MPFPNRHSIKRGGFRRGKGSRNFSSQGAYKRPKTEYRHQDQLTEEEVGISEYISKLEGYPAVIKARFSDFQVNEINKDGKMAKLTDKNTPKSFIMQQKKHSYEETIKTPLENIPQEIWDALKNLVKNTGGVPVILDAENLSKDDRRNVHACVKSYFGQEIIASTITKDEKSVLEFRKYEKGEKDSRVQWPDNTPEFVHFIVYKEMMDTMEACFRIGQVLCIPATKITYAGVKDRRAKTSQWFCVKKYEPSKLVEKTKRIRNLHVGNIEFKEKYLKIGDLKGNRFRIALRNVKANDDLITKSMEHVKEQGFINYYGLQRFGNDKEAPTFQIGIKLLQGQWKEAVDLILKVKAGDDPFIGINKAKKLYAETRNAENALKLCDKKVNSVVKLNNFLDNMKLFLLFVALVGFVSADSASDLAVLQNFLECCDKAMKEGVPTIPVPVHEPLVISDFVYSGGNALLSYKVGLTNTTLHDLTNYTFPVLNASSYSNPEGVAFGYQIYWPQLNFTGQWEVDVKVPFVDNDMKGTYNIVLNHVDWWGVFNLTKPGQEAQGYNNTVNAFSLESSTKSVDVIVTGVTSGEGVVEETIRAGLMLLMNNFPAQGAEFLRTQRFNDFWIGHPEKLRQLLDFCGYP